MGKNFRMPRYERLSTDGGFLDGTGIDPAPEIVNRTDVDAAMEQYAKTIVITEQVETCVACYKFSVNTLESLNAA